MGLTRQGHFLHELFHKQFELVVQLQSANNAFEDQVMQAQDNITSAATKAVSEMAQAILGNVPRATCCRMLKQSSWRALMGAVKMARHNVTRS